MPDLATHPTDDAIAAFALGKSQSFDDSLVEDHLTGCDQCQQRAEAVAPDTVVQLLAAVRTRADADRLAAPTPTLDGYATPPAFAPTLPYEGAGGPALTAAPPALADHPKYRVVRRLGVGGMGSVWLAEHTVMHRQVAVKVIRPDLLAKPGATERFLREVRAAAKLHHPNIVTAFDAEPVGDSCLLVMEYVPGETLGERVKVGPLPAAEACRAVRDAACGLAHAHAAGLVHRDVKPHNLIRVASRDASAPGVVKVLDFGLAGVGAGESIAHGGTGLTGAGMVVGTPDYIAPEQATDPHAADARADIYGLGCTLYHLLAGRPPVPEGSIMQKLDAQRTRDPDPIPGLAAGVAAVLAKMIAKRPEERYQTADEVVAALQEVIDTECVETASASRRRSLRGLLVATALMFAIAAGVGGFIVKFQRDNQETTIRTDDPDIEVVVKRNGEVVLIRDGKTGQTWTYDAIKNQIGQASTEEGLQLGLPEKGEFVLKRDGKQVFSVTRIELRKIEIKELPATQSAKPDTEAILGAWRGVAAEVGGETMPQEFIDMVKPTLTFSSDKATGRPQGTIPKSFLEMAASKGMLTPLATTVLEKGVEGVYHLDPSKSPKQIDFTTLGEFRRTGLGIYTLDGDTLKLCMSIDPEKVADRPTEFATKPGQMRVILTLKRIVPAPTGEERGTTQPAGPQRPASTSGPAKHAAATKAADAWLKLVDAGKYAEAWDQSASFAKKVRGKEEFVQTYEQKAQQLGKLKSRVFSSLTTQAGGNIVSIHYTSSFEKLNEASEQLLMRLDVDGEYRAMNYAARTRPPAARKPDHELIQGKWQAVSGTHDEDVEFTRDQLKLMTITFAGDTATVAHGVSHTGTFTLDQTRSPKHISVIASAEENFHDNFGIYSLEGDTLRICMGDTKMGRPTEFKSKIGDKLFVNIVFKRAATEKQPPGRKP